MNLPSPLVPQGSIPPKNTSRSKRVLLIGFAVVVFHAGGLLLVLMQGCQKDSTKTAGLGETNSTALSLPALDTNPPAPYYTSATSLPSAAFPSISTNPPPMVASNASVSLQEPPTSLPQTSFGGADPVPSNEKDYSIVRGDTLSEIARTHRVSLSALLASNPNLDPKKLKVGQVVKIPVSTASASTATASQAPSSSASPSVPTGGTYKVKPGDNLIRIAKAHGVTVTELRAANNMRSTQIQAGRVLKIPGRTQKTAAAPQ